VDEDDVDAVIDNSDLGRGWGSGGRFALDDGRFIFTAEGGLKFV